MIPIEVFGHVVGYANGWEILAAFLWASLTFAGTLGLVQTATSRRRKSARHLHYVGAPSDVQARQARRELRHQNLAPARIVKLPEAWWTED